MAAMRRDPITCHVLNTLTGRPAANLAGTLTLLSPTFGPDGLHTFHAVTDSDGRIKSWTPLSPTPSTVSGVLAALPDRDSRTDWAIRFAVGEWFEAQGIESFWPEVEIKFTVRGREGEEGWRHYHVPVLLGPWSYSTYRGS
jgi:5-hydroxyisourate hydrolase